MLINPKSLLAGQHKENQLNLPNGNQTNIKINRKVMISLKQQMSNIRQGMSKLMRIKSQQALQISSNRPTKQNMINQNTYKHNANQENRSTQKPLQHELKRMQQKIRLLQEQNSILNLKLKQLENQNRLQKQGYEKKYLQLEAQNNQLQITINCLRNQIFQISKNRRRSKQNKSNNKNSRMNNFIQFPFSHLRQQSSKNFHSAEWLSCCKIEKQNEGIMKELQKLEHKLKIIQKINKQNVQLIQILNEKLVRWELAKLEQKFTQVLV